jgi:hypothetical protein
MKFTDVLFLNFAGVIRGAIAFGLVLRLDESLENRNVIITTVLALVIVTTIIFGATMTILKVALLEDNSILSSPNSSQNDADHEEYNLQVKAPLLRNSSTSQSFKLSYTENKFSTSFMDLHQIFVEERQEELDG